MVDGVASKPICLLLLIAQAGFIAGTTPTTSIFVCWRIVSKAEVEAVLHAITRISTCKFAVSINCSSAKKAGYDRLLTLRAIRQ